MRKAIPFILLCSLLIMLPVLLNAAGPPPPPPKGKAPSNIPIAGGIGILILAGIAYGSKKIYDAGRKNKQ